MHQVETFTDEITKRAIASLIESPKPLILDVGCYDGKDAAGIASYFENAQVHCFECDYRSVDVFKKINGSNNKLILHDFALTNTDGTIEFYQSDSKSRRHYSWQGSWSASSSTRKPKEHLSLFPDVTFENKVKVRSKKLDTWFFNEIHLFNPKRNIDFLWCDVNGAEGEFISGGYHTLNDHTKFLYIEFEEKELYEGRTGKDELLKLLPNFELLGIYNFKGYFGNLLLRNTAL